MQLTLAPLRRIARADENPPTTEQWSWDFIVDGQSIAEQIDGDVVGVFGSSDEVWNENAALKLTRRSPPDLPPNRVALFVCPECGGISCGAATVAVDVTDDVVVWHHFRWERDWEGAGDDRDLPIGPFEFARHSYFSLIDAGARISVDAATDWLAAS